MSRSLVTIIALSFSSSLSAASFQHESLEDGTEMIVIEGTILKGDDEKFRDLSVRYPKAAIVLDSPGGALVPSLEIGRIVRLRGYSTIVLDDSECSSSCALIWMAGGRRIIQRGGMVGFHASYVDNGGNKVESGVGNALVGHYLSQMSFPTPAVVFATQAPPDEINWLTESSRGRSGIDFESYEKEDDAEEGPTAANSPAPPEVPEPVQAQTDRWIVVGETTEGTIWYIDRTDYANGRPNQTFAPMWVKLDHRKDSSTTFRETVARYTVNCPQKTFRADRITRYSPDGTSRDLPKSFSFEYALPDTVLETAIMMLCAAE